MLEGVKNSADMDENMGTKLGGLGEVTAVASTSRTVSRDGWTPNWVVMRSIPRAIQWLGVHTCDAIVRNFSFEEREGLAVKKKLRMSRIEL
jgi:hypothetical protein